MKYHSLIFIVLSLPIVGCDSATDSVIETPSVNEQLTVPVSLNLDFDSSETDWNQSPLTRATTSDIPPTRISLQIFNTDGTPTIAQIDQNNTDPNFGKFSDLRLTPGSYKCVIVAHRASSVSQSAATITSLTEAFIPESSLWDTHTCVYDFTVTPGTYTPQEHTIQVPLCVTRFNLTLLDPVAAGVSKVRLTLNSVSSSVAIAPIALNPSTGLATSDLAFTRTWDIQSTTVGKTNINFSITGLFTTYPKTCDAKVEALDAEGIPLYTRTLQNITFNRAKIRKVSTNLFTGAVDAIINFEGWTNEDETIVIP